MSSGNRPAVGLFCSTFLKPEMLHISRHIAGLQGFRPVVLTQKREGNFTADIVEVIPRSPWRFLSRFREKQNHQPWQISRGEASRLLEVVEDHECALVHVFFGNAAAHLLPFLSRLKVPFLVSFHGSDVAGSMASAGYSPAVNELFHLAQAIPCRSEQLGERVLHLGCPPKKLRLMRTVLPEIAFRQRQAPGDRRWHLVQAARLVAKKGIDLSLEAFAEFRKQYPESTFTIAGEGPLLEELQRQAQKLGLGSSVKFAGFLDQASLQRLFAEAHIFLHPSRTARGDVEGVPNAMLEAMASGLPVVATKHGGIPEVISTSECGILCPENDAPALAGALLDLAGDPGEYALISAAGSARVRDQFSARRGIAAIENLYHEVILAHQGTEPAKLRAS